MIFNLIVFLWLKKKVLKSLNLYTLKKHRLKFYMEIKEMKKILFAFSIGTALLLSAGTAFADEACSDGFCVPY